MHLLLNVGILLPIVSYIVVNILLFIQRWKYRHIPSIPIPWTFSWFKGHYPEFVRRVKKDPHKHKGIVLGELVPDDKPDISIVFLYNQGLILVVDVPVIAKLMTDRNVYTKRPLFGIWDTMSGVRIGGKYGLIGDIGSDVWAAKRKVEDKAFGKGALKETMIGMNILSNRFMDTMQKRSDVGETFDIMPDLTMLALHTIAKCGFDWSDDMINKHSEMILNALNSANMCMGLTMKDPIGFKIPWTYKGEKGDMRKYVLPVRQVIRKFLEENMEAARNKVNILGHIIRAHEVSDQLTIDDVVDEFVIFFGAGMDTTAATMSALVWFIVRHPDIYQKVQEEVDSVYGDKEDLAFEDLNKLVYLEMVIKESLRLKGPAPVLAKQMADNVSATVDGWYFPEGAKFTILVSKVHRHPTYWQDPYKFNPERFAPDKKIVPFSYMPFSAGQRNCVGRHFAMTEMKNSLSKLFRNFVLSNGNPSETDLLLTGDFTQYPMKGIDVVIQNRTI